MENKWNCFKKFSFKNNTWLVFYIIQARIAQKEVTLVKYQELLNQARDDMMAMNKRHEKELRRLQEKLHSKSDVAFNKFKEHAIQMISKPQSSIPTNDQVSTLRNIVDSYFRELNCYEIRSYEVWCDITSILASDWHKNFRLVQNVTIVWMLVTWLLCCIVTSEGHMTSSQLNIMITLERAKLIFHHSSEKIMPCMWQFTNRIWADVWLGVCF